MLSDNPRRDARLQYSAGPRPKLILDSADLDVLDLSERGLRYRLEGGPEPRIGSQVEGILRLSSGETLPVRGTVVRVTSPSGAARAGAWDVAIRLGDAGVPRRVMVAERLAIGSEPPSR